MNPTNTVSRLCTVPAMRALFLTGLLGAGGSNSIQALAQSPAQGGESGGAGEVELLTQAARAIIEQSNDFRGRNGLPSLAPNEQLTEAAEEFARYMARSDQYSHEADGRTPVQRARDSGYEDCVIRENLAYRQTSAEPAVDALAQTLVQGWIDSPGHRENLLGPHILETGVAVATQDSATFYAVQMFGRPRDLAFQVEVHNPGSVTHELILGQGDAAQKLELPANAQVTATRCVPVLVSLSNRAQSLLLDESAVFEVVSVAGEPAILQRREDSAGE